VLSFDYSRDRLGGMAVVFYALAAYFALCRLDAWRRGVSARAAVVGAASEESVGAAVRRPAWITAVLLFLVNAGWTLRGYGTVESV
jgi:hypothetical protein